MATEPGPCLAVLSRTGSIMPLSRREIRAHHGDMTSTTLLVRHPLYPDRLVARPCRRVDRLVARLLAPTLDRRLADGCPPEGDRLLATRAQVLVADDNRRAVAANWERLLWAARHPAGHHRGVTLCR